MNGMEFNLRIAVSVDTQPPPSLIKQENFMLSHGKCLLIKFRKCFACSSIRESCGISFKVNLLKSNCPALANGTCTAKRCKRTLPIEGFLPTSIGYWEMVFYGAFSVDNENQVEVGKVNARGRLPLGE